MLFLIRLNLLLRIIGSVLPLHGKDRSLLTAQSLKIVKPRDSRDTLEARWSLKE